MPIRIVQSKQNTRLKELRRALLAPARGGDGLAGAVVGIEGRNLLVEALRARLAVRCVFVAHEEERLLDGLELPREAEILLLPRQVLASVQATETPQPVAALVEPFDWTWRDVLEPEDGRAPLLVLLAGLQDPGNLGTILRSAEAFGASGVVSLPGTVHAWNPKAVRASAGSVFRVPVIASNEAECFARLREAGVRIWTTGAEDGTRAATPADGADLRGPGALLIGNEGKGVPAELAAEADGAIAIPCPGPVESLNAAVAASVLLYEASRQRAGSISHPFSAAAGRDGEWMGHGEPLGRGERMGQERSAAKKTARSRR
jgi:TrmH family RNA methyltransferase